MTFARLVRRGLTHYWRSNLAVVGGVAVAAAVLGGALLVGESVRASLRRIALERIGRTHSAIAAPHLFREQLADRFPGSAPLLVFEGIAVHQSSGRRAGKVAVYGVDERFAKFHGWPSLRLEGRDSDATGTLRQELGASPGDTLLLRIEPPSDIPAESLFGRKDRPASALRLTFRRNAPGFSLQPGQAPLRAVYVPLGLLQREVGAPGRVNTILLAQPVARVPAALDDLGLRLKPVPDGTVQLDSRSGILSAAVVHAAGPAARASLTYLATDMRIGSREIPYSLVAAAGLAQLPIPAAAAADPNAIVLNEWAARDLAAAPGDTLTMEYLLWRDDGRSTTGSASFTVTAITRIAGAAADRDLTPEYPGITGATDISDWDPPFPMDLGRIRPRDEEYWDRYRTTPKAWLPLERGQQLWRSRWGQVTALRLPAAPDLEQKLLASLDPAAHGLGIVDVRAQALEASRGATDFGEYFLYFSFFLMASALLLAGLFFRLGIEQRLTQLGLLDALGFTRRRVSRLFLAEGLALAGAGGGLGIACAWAYAALVLLGLRTWWVDAVGTTELALHAGPGPLLAGALGGVGAGAAAIWSTLRSLRGTAPRALLAGAGPELVRKQVAGAGKSLRAHVSAGFLPAASAAAALLLLTASATNAMPAAGGFFGAGLCLLIAALAGLRVALARAMPAATGGRTALSTITGLAGRNSAIRPGRTVLVVSLIASATFLLVSVEAFRRGAGTAAADESYPLLAESVRPIYYDLNSDEGREAMNLPASNAPAMAGVSFLALRLRPGEDASCLNLYRPGNPRVLGAPPEIRKATALRFASVWKPAAGNLPADDPWAILDAPLPDGAIPAAVDANSLAYVLHKSLGDVIELPGEGVKLRLAATLSDSVFQGELVISERNFKRAFPAIQGYRVFLISAPTAAVEQVTAQIESALADHGFDATSVAARLASFHRVENTYLSTFQSLGGLGLLLGTLGLAALLIRNVLERRRELALLAAVGFAPARLRRLVLSENLAILLAGEGAGAASALLAILPGLAAHGRGGPPWSVAALLVVVFAAGGVAVWLATRIALRAPLLVSLRAG